VELVQTKKRHSVFITIELRKYFRD